MATSTIEIVARDPYDGGAQALSGARFERALLADGRVVILKHLPPEGDWLTRLADGAGRARMLWESGLLEEVGRTIEQPVIGTHREDGHDVVVMVDVGDTLLQPAGRCASVTPGQVARLLAGMAALHTRWEGCEVDGLCTPARRHRLLSPLFHQADTGPHPHPNREPILAGWEAFAELAPPDVAQAVFAVHRDSSGLEKAMRDATAWTLLHGDAKPDNLGLRGDRLVLIDWGELTGVGPAEMDLTWFVMQGTRPLPVAPGGRIEAMPDDLLATYEAHRSRRLDARVVDLACIGMMAQLGWSLACPPALDVAVELRHRAAQLMDWWVARVRRGLETWSPM